MLVFDVVRGSRSSAGERPPHTRKVAGSKPAGTTEFMQVNATFPAQRSGSCYLRAMSVSGRYATLRLVRNTPPTRKANKTMTTTTTNPHPNIAPPAGAETLCTWADWDNEFRFVFSETRVDGTNFVLSPCAAQLPDGSIDTDATVTNDPPHVTIYLVDGQMHEGLRVGLKDARKLVKALSDAVDRLDRWATT